MINFGVTSQGRHDGHGLEEFRESGKGVEAALVNFPMVNTHVGARDEENAPGGSEVGSSKS
jgi:hypothetical protein